MRPLTTPSAPATPTTMPAICPPASVFESLPFPEPFEPSSSDPAVEVSEDASDEDAVFGGVIVLDAGEVDDGWLALLLLSLLVAFEVELPPPVVIGGDDEDGGADDEEPDPNAMIKGPLVALDGGLSLPSSTM